MTPTRRGFTLIEALAATGAAAAALATLVVAMGSGQGDVRIAVSLNNLRTLGQMHATYASEWDGRQWTVTPDDLSERIGGYHTSYDPSIAPPVGLGFDCEGEFHETSRGWAIQPMWYIVNCSLGNFRAWNTRPFHQYANGKVYDPLFWAPRDLDLPTGDKNDLRKRLRDLFTVDCEWPGEGTRFIFPTYCMSIAAQVDPRVYRGPQDGGSNRALDFPLGHRTPNLAAARYPELKTHMMEHFWLNPWPKPPFVPNTGGVPWFFNMSDRAEPATLFFDGSVRLLPNLEVLVSNDIVVRQGEDRLWADDRSCFGSGGYFENFAEPPSNFHVESLVDQTSSHHVFTRDGILGRDTIFSK